MNTRLKSNILNLPHIKHLLEINQVVLVKNGVIIRHYEEQFVNQSEYEAVKDLETLQSISIKDNKVIRIEFHNTELTSLPESIGNLVNLQNLDLDGNKLTALPESFGNLVNLQKLFLNDNKLTSLPESFGNLVNLQHLDLEFNKLTLIPESFRNLVNLQTLNIENNNFKADFSQNEENIIKKLKKQGCKFFSLQNGYK